MRVRTSCSRESNPRTKLFGETHGAPENATEGNILTEDNGRVIFGQCGTVSRAEFSKCARSSSRTYLIASRTAWYMFIRRVSLPATTSFCEGELSSSIQRRPGVRSAASRVVRK